MLINSPHASVGHHVILAHAHAVKIYRDEFKPAQNGVIGITLNGDWALPYNDRPESEYSLITSHEYRIHRNLSLFYR